MTLPSDVIAREAGRSPDGRSNLPTLLWHSLRSRFTAKWSQSEIPHFRPSRRQGLNSRLRLLRSLAMTLLLRIRQRMFTPGFQAQSNDVIPSAAEGSFKFIPLENLRVGKFPPHRPSPWFFGMTTIVDNVASFVSLWTGRRTSHIARPQGIFQTFLKFSSYSQLERKRHRYNCLN